jgi:short-subunit dehydrogenase
VAPVTGAGKKTGIDFEVCRQLAMKGFAVCLTARSQATA